MNCWQRVEWLVVDQRGLHHVAAVVTKLHTSQPLSTMHGLSSSATQFRFMCLTLGDIGSTHNCHADRVLFSGLGAGRHIHVLGISLQCFIVCP